MANPKTAKNATATATAPKTGKKGISKVAQTSKLIDRKLATKAVGGHYGKLPRQVILAELQDEKKANMTPRQSQTYYHNELRRRSKEDSAIAAQLAEGREIRKAASAAKKAKAAKPAAAKKAAKKEAKA